MKKAKSSKKKAIVIDDDQVNKAPSTPKSKGKKKLILLPEPSSADALVESVPNPKSISASKSTELGELEPAEIPKQRRSKLKMPTSDPGPQTLKRFNVSSDPTSNRAPNLRLNPAEYGKNSVRLPPNRFLEANETLEELQDSYEDLNLSPRSKTRSLVPLKQKVLPEMVTRKVLFDDFESPEVYPVNKLMDTLLKYGKSKNLVLSFSGVEQLTDIVFGNLLDQLNVLKTKGNNSGADLPQFVTGVSISGCPQITDQGVLWMIQCFPKVHKVKMNGCRNLTERSLKYLAQYGEKLTDIQAVATGICCVPRTLTTVTLSMEGSPLLSPALPDLQDHLQKTGTGLFSDVKTFRACVFPVTESCSNFSLYLTNGTAPTQSQTAYFGHSELKLSDGSVCNVTECPEVVLSWPMFLSERTVYILPYDASQGDVGQITSAIFRFIIHISAQVTEPVFIAVGTMASTSVKEALSKDQKACEEQLKKELDIFSNKEKVETMTYQEQCRLGKARQLLDRIQTALDKLKVLEINTSNPKDRDPLLNALIKVRDEDLKTAYPEYSEISSELLTAVSNIPKLLPKGVATEEAAIKSIREGKWPKNLSSDLQIQKALHFAKILGLVVQVPSVTEAGYVARPDWLMKVINSLVSSTGGKSGVENTSPHGIPLVSLENIQDSIAQTVVQTLGVGCVKGDNFCLVSSLPDEPCVPVSYLWDSPKRSCDLEIGYTYSFPHLVSNTVLTKIQHSVVEYYSRSVKVMWKSGVILQDAVVDIFFEKTEEKSGRSSLTLKGRVLDPGEGLKDEHRKAVEILWHSLEQWKLILDSVLHDLHLYAQVQCQSELQKPGSLSPIVTNHVIKLISGKDRCEKCYIPAAAARFLWEIARPLYPIFLDNKLMEQSSEEAVQVEGTVWKSKPGKVCSVSVKVDLNHYGDSKVGATVIKGEKSDIAGVKLSLHSNGENKVTYQNGNVNVEGPRKSKPLKQVTIVTGDTVSFDISRSSDIPLSTAGAKTSVSAVKKSSLNVRINGDLIYTHEVEVEPAQIWTFTWEQEEAKQQVALMVDIPKALGVHGRGAIIPGMRLEARDRKNPLICVATIEKIAEDGQLLIHFDGWTDRYDYWADPTSPDLHPLGYQDFIGHTHKQYRPELQKPKGYPKAFDWGVYLQEINSFPVPHAFFNQEQTEGTPPTEELRALEVAGLSISRASTLISSCSFLSNRPLCLEQKVYSMLSDDTSLQRLWTECNSLTKFPCLLPAEFDKQKLNIPARRLVTDLTKQKIHFLCSGQGMESLHFVNSQGHQTNIDMSDFKSLASVIRFIVLVLSSQETFLPSKAVKFCPGIDTVPIAESESKVIKVLFQYLLHLELLLPWKQYSKTPHLDPGVTAKLSEKLFKSSAELSNSSISVDFPGAAGSESHLLRCQAHTDAVCRNHDLLEIPLEKFQGLSHLIFRLDFQKNKLTSIPTSLGDEFPFLSHLNMADNSITEIPENICNLPSLEWLDISANKISKLPASFVKLEKSLVYLNLSNNPLGKFPDVALKLVHLEELRASNVGEIGSLQGIDKLIQLKVLSLGGNLLTQPLHENFGKMTNLVELDMPGLPWFTGYESPKSALSYEAFCEFLNKNNILAKLEKQKLFNEVDKAGKGSLDAQEVAELNSILFTKYPRFGDKKQAPTKNMKSCEGGLPEVILSLTNLHILNLGFHSLHSIPPALGSSLTKLHNLTLSDNPVLETLAAEVGSLPLKELHLKRCEKLKTPPKEVINRGFGAVFGYLKRLAMGSVSCRRTKLMVVGLGGAGKTSLIQALTRRRYINTWDADDMYEIMGEAITDGIDITNWKVKVEPKAGKGEGQVNKKDDSIEYSVWDFAGQTVYYNTHQFFLSTRAVYLLLWNIRLGYEHAGLDFWLSSIACHAPGAPILVVGTHCDKVEKTSMPTEELRRRYPQIRGFHCVSSFSLQGIPELQNYLIDVTLQEKYMGEQIPEAWLTMESRIQEKRTDKQLLPFKAIEAIGNRCGIFDHVELTQAIEFLHDLGSVQFFNTDFLRSYVVINPQWIVDVMTCVVSVHEGAIKEGRFYHRDLGTVWEAYPAEMHTWLLRLTEEFDLTFPLLQEDANLVPCLLPDKEPKYNWPEVDRVKGHKETKMLYKFRYLPAGLFNRVQVRLHQFSDDAVIWKKGSLLKKNTHMALILQIGVDEMLIKVQGPRPENILFLVHEVMETLVSESFYGVQYDFSVPCSDCLEVQSLDPSMFCSSKVQRALELKAPFLQCDRYFHTLSITELHATMPADKNADIDIHLGKSVRELQDLHSDLVIKTYFCYCAKNVPAVVGDKLVHPDSITEGLRKAGMKVTPNELTSGEDITKLTLTIKESDVVMVGMSDEFAEDKTCVDFLYFVRETLRKTVILVILGTGFEWKKSKVGILCANDVYVSMQQADNFRSKLSELVSALKKRTVKNKNQVKDYPGCFISYSWANSKRALDLGARPKDGSLGWADPREVKDFLGKNGISCWLDVEQVGKGGLYEDIAEGLRQAKAMVAFVSDEYAESKNCQMEFRYAVTTLKIPTILAVVGTGYKWERTEVGMLSVGYECPKINFQYENFAANKELLELVKKLLPKQESVAETQQPERNEQQVAFQEVLELTQRKFLRHVISYADSMDSTPYPRLIVLDITGEQNQQQQQQPPTHTKQYPDSATLEDFEKISKFYEVELNSSVGSGEKDKPVQHSKYCFTLLCEHDEGWHDVYPSIPLAVMSAQEEEVFTADTSGYMARLFAILKHTNLTMGCLTTKEGERLRSYLDGVVENKSPEFQEEYVKIRRLVMELDKEGIMGNLKKCQLPNGRSAWLCEKHQPVSKLTDLSPGGENISDIDKTEMSSQTTNQTAPPMDDQKADMGNAVAEEQDSETSQPAETRPPLRALNKGQTAKGGTNKATSRACSVM